MRKTHGESTTRLYRIWQYIKGKHYSSDNAHGCYEVCKPWLEDFGKFKAWSVSSGYTDSSRLRRLDESSCYAPDNAYWYDTGTLSKIRSDNIINKKFGRLTVMREVPLSDRKPGRRAYVCMCECGKETIVQSHNLVSGQTKSCGCLTRGKRKQTRHYIFEPGERLGALTVLERTDVGYGPRVYRCKCDCGNIVFIYGVDLNDASITSCGQCHKIQQQTPVQQHNPLDTMWDNF